MGYYNEIRTIIIFVEKRVNEKHIDYSELERAIGFSMAHIRDIFISQSGIPLMKYVEMRKIVNSCCDLLYSSDKVIDIAFKYGFNSHETYSRAFRRVVGVTPISFRRERLKIEKEELISGVYGLSLAQKNNKNRGGIRMIKGNENLNEKGKYEDNESTILYGVPKVGYGVYGCTPYPICLKACANYLGEDVDYSFVMAASGAAFRMTWDKGGWNLGNVDIYNAFDEPNKVYGVGPNALGRDFGILVRNEDTTKEEFIDFIKRNIDKGFPCIALGIIGPPEACIITGYKDNGNTLLGWNFFQEQTDFAGSIQFDKCGYFICDNWWENLDTQAVMCMGESKEQKAVLKEIVKNSITVMTGRKYDIYSKGIDAYDSWKEYILNEHEFKESNNLALLNERLMCQEDAISCLLDGRGNASIFFSKAARESEDNKDLLNKLAVIFDNSYKAVEKMLQLTGGWERSEEKVHNFAKREVREKIAELIDVVKGNDIKALMLLNELDEKL